MRTDANNNPTAFTTDLARQGLVIGVDYEIGDKFPHPSNLCTAKLLGDPIAITIKLIDIVGYYTMARRARWDYIALPKWVWQSLTYEGKRDVIGFHYEREGGTAMKALFPNYGRR